MASKSRITRVEITGDGPSRAVIEHLTESEAFARALGAKDQWVVTVYMGDGLDRRQASRGGFGGLSPAEDFAEEAIAKADALYAAWAKANARMAEFITNFRG